MHRSHRKARALVSLALALLAFAAFGAAAARAQLGVAVGGNFNQLSDIQTEPEATFDNASGFHVGLFYDLALGPVSLRPGVFYVDLGEFDAAVGGFNAGTFDLNLVEIPVDVRVRLAAAPVVRPYLLAGPVFRFASTGNDDFNESLNPFTYAGNVGLGLEIGAPGGLTLFPELRYSFGVTSLTDDFTFLGAGFEADEDQHLNVFMLRLGVAF